MAADTQRRSWTFPVFFSAFILVLACLAQLSEHRWTDNLRLSQTDIRSGLLSSGLNNPQRGASTIFDPVLAYSTFLGGANAGLPGGTPQGAVTIFVDGLGNIYVAGNTNSANFPVTPGVVQSTNPQHYFGVFLSEINPGGTSLIFSTYIVGLLSVSALTIDSSHNIYVAGSAISPGSSVPPLPIPPGSTPFQALPRGRNVGIIKLNGTATAVLNATYLGGSGAEQVSGLAVDAGGNVYVTGTTVSNDFPTMNPVQGSLGSSVNVFVSKLDSSLHSLVYSTYLGNSSAAASGPGPRGIAVDAFQDAYVVGHANAGFVTTPGAPQGTCTASNFCAFLAKLNNAGSSLLYATYLGGSNYSQANAVAVDAFQNVFVGGQATAPFPLVNPLPSCGSNNSGFIAEANSAGSLIFSTCLANIADLALDASGNVYVAGSASPAPSAVLNNPIQANPTGAFVAAINPTAHSLLFSSFVGGAQPFEQESLVTIGVDSAGDIYGAGTAMSFVDTANPQFPPPFPIFNALQPTPGAILRCPFCQSSDAIIFKILPIDAAAAALSPALVSFPAQLVGTPSSSQAVTIFDLGTAALTVSNSTVTGDFSIQNGCTSVAAAGGTCAIQVTFTPTAVGTRTGTLTITDSSAGSPRTVQLTGQGGLLAAILSPSSLSFQNQAVGTTSSPQQITLTNTGAVPLQILHLQTSGPFSETNACGTTLGPSQGCFINVSFTPTATGIIAGALTITDSAADSPQTIPLTGNTRTNSLGLAVSPGGSSSATVTAGTSASYTLSVGGSGISGTASLSCTGAPAAAVCSVPTTVSVIATTASTFNVSVSTTSHTQVIPEAIPSPARFWAEPWLWVLAIIGLLLLLRAAKAERVGGLLLRFAPLLALALYVCGCGSSGSHSSSFTPTGTYTLVVTAQSGSTTQSQNLTLMVH